MTAGLRWATVVLVNWGTYDCELETQFVKQHIAGHDQNEQPNEPACNAKDHDGVRKAIRHDGNEGAYGAL